MGFLCLSAKFVKSSQFTHKNSIFKTSIPNRGLLGQWQSTGLDPVLSLSSFSTHSLCGQWEALLTSLRLGFLIYKTGTIMDYRNVNITTDNVSRCSVSSTAFLYSSWGSHGKHTGVACHSLLQWIMFCQNSLLWPVCLGGPTWHGS